VLDFLAMFVLTVGGVQIDAKVAFEWAAQPSSLAAVQQLIILFDTAPRRRPDGLNLDDELEAACSRACLGIVRLLLAISVAGHRVGVHARGNAAFQAAAREGHLPIV